MAYRQFKCTNTGFCRKADTGEIISSSAIGEVFCPECGKELVSLEMGAPASGARKIPLPLILGGVGAAAVAGLALYFGPQLLRGGKTGSAATVRASPTAAPASGQASASPAVPVVVSGDTPALNAKVFFLYEKSLQKWIEPLRDQINAASKGRGELSVDYRGSRDGFRDILDGKSQPVLWNPADIYWTEKLRQAWRDPKYGGRSGDIISDAPAVIVTSRLVLVMRPDRAQVFGVTSRRPEYRNQTWKLLYDLATKGWGPMGGSESWGKLRLAHSNPLESNSGAQTLALMFAEYKREHPGARPSSPEFQQFMGVIEKSVVKFQDTTSNVLKDLTSGKADIAIAYEQNAVAKADEGEDIRFLYPSPTVLIRFPAVVLNAPWVTPEQAKDGQKVIDYLLSADAQKQLIERGFRPSRNDLRSEVDRQLNAGKRADAGFLMSPAALDAAADVATLNDLQFQWAAQFGR